jgi:hypothetical protein
VGGLLEFVLELTLELTTGAGELTFVTGALLLAVVFSLAVWLQPIRVKANAVAVMNPANLNFMEDLLEAADGASSETVRAHQNMARAHIEPTGSRCHYEGVFGTKTAVESGKLVSSEKLSNQWAE